MLVSTRSHACFDSFPCLFRLVPMLETKCFLGRNKVFPCWELAKWIEKLDDLMKLSGRQLLVGKGAITHEQAKQKAIAEFEKYRKMEMLQYESDYDRAIKELIQKENSLPKAGANKESEEP